MEMLINKYQQCLDADGQRITNWAEGIEHDMMPSATQAMPRIPWPNSFLRRAKTLFLPRRVTPPKLIGQLSATYMYDYLFVDLPPLPTFQKPFPIVAEFSFLMSLMSSLKTISPSVSSKPLTSTDNILSWNFKLRINCFFLLNNTQTRLRPFEMQFFIERLRRRTLRKFKILGDISTEKYNHLSLPLNFIWAFKDSIPEIIWIVIVKRHFAFLIHWKTAFLWYINIFDSFKNMLHVTASD